MAGTITAVGRGLLSIPVNASASGDNIVIPADSAGRAIRVMAARLIAASAVTITMCSGSGTSKILDGPCPIGANGGYVLPEIGGGWFEGAAGQAINMSLGGAVQVGGVLIFTYR